MATPSSSRQSFTEVPLSGVTVHSVPSPVVQASSTLGGSPSYPPPPLIRHPPSRSQPSSSSFSSRRTARPTSSHLLRYTISTETSSVSDLRLQVCLDDDDDDDDEGRPSNPSHRRPPKPTSSSKPKRPVYFRERTLSDATHEGEEDEIVDKLIDAKTGQVLWSIHRPKRGWYLHIRSPRLPRNAAIPLRPYVSPVPEPDVTATPLSFTLGTRLATSSLASCVPFLEDVERSGERIGMGSLQNGHGSAELRPRAPPSPASSQQTISISAADEVSTPVPTPRTGESMSSLHVRKRSGAAVSSSTSQGADGSSAEAKTARREGSAQHRSVSGAREESRHASSSSISSAVAGRVLLGSASPRIEQSGVAAFGGQGAAEASGVKKADEGRKEEDGGREEQDEARDGIDELRSNASSATRRGAGRSMLNGRPTGSNGASTTRHQSQSSSASRPPGAPPPPKGPADGSNRAPRPTQCHFLVTDGLLSTQSGWLNHVRAMQAKQDVAPGRVFRRQNSGNNAAAAAATPMGPQGGSVIGVSAAQASNGALAAAASPDGGGGRRRHDNGHGITIDMAHLDASPRHGSSSSSQQPSPTSPVSPSLESSLDAYAAAGRGTGLGGMRLGWARWAWSLLPEQIRPSLGLDTNKSFSVRWTDPPPPPPPSSLGGANANGSGRSPSSTSGGGAATQQQQQQQRRQKSGLGFEVLRFEDTSGWWMGAKTEGRLSISRHALQTLGLDVGLWIAITLAYVEFLEERDGYNAAVSG